MKKYLITMMSALLLLTGCQQKTERQSEAIEYPLLTLKSEDRELSVSYSAVIEGKQDVEVRPQISEIGRAHV